MTANPKAPPKSSAGDASQRRPEVWIQRKKTDSPSFLAEAVPLTQAALNPSSSKQAFLAHYDVGNVIYKMKVAYNKNKHKMIMMYTLLGSKVSIITDGLFIFV